MRASSSSVPRWLPSCIRDRKVATKMATRPRQLKKYYIIRWPWSAKGKSSHLRGNMWTHLGLNTIKMWIKVWLLADFIKMQLPYSTIPTATTLKSPVSLSLKWTSVLPCCLGLGCIWNNLNYLHVSSHLYKSWGDKVLQLYWPLVGKSQCQAEWMKWNEMAI